MRPVARSSVAGPASLLVPGRAGPNEREKARAHHGPPRAAGSFTFGAYKGADVRLALEALFHGKCAYCESRFDVNAPVDVEHFRPKGGVEGTDHPGYWWFAADWGNLLPSCIDCNRRRYQPTPIAFASLNMGLGQVRQTGFALIKSGKESSFPIADTGVRISVEPEADRLEEVLRDEHALLLDPCRDDPRQHLRFFIDRDFPLGIVYPAGSTDVVLPLAAQGGDPLAQVERQAREAGVSVKGAVSIQTYGLNRLALVQERTRMLRRLEFLGNLLVEVSAVADAVEGLPLAEFGAQTQSWAVVRLRANGGRIMAELRSFTAPHAPFSEMARAWLKAFVADLRRSAHPGLPIEPDETT